MNTDKSYPESAKGRLKLFQGSSQLTELPVSFGDFLKFVLMSRRLLGSPRLFVLTSVLLLGDSCGMVLICRRSLGSPRLFVLTWLVLLGPSNPNPSQE